MKLQVMIKKLQKLKEKHGNIDVIVDYDENGWYSSEKVEVEIHKEEDDEKGVKFINIKTNNEC